MMRFISNNIKGKILLPAVLLLMSMGLLVSCMDETLPTDSVTPDQIGTSEASQEALLNGIVSMMIDYSTWGTSDYRNDFGYPCQMLYREVQGEDFPVYNSDYSYWYTVEAGTNTNSTSAYSYNYYYHLVKAANSLLSTLSGNVDGASEKSKHYYGAALAFRALAYLDMARMFEFQPTGFESLDAQAKQNGCMGLTVPIVDEIKTLEDLKHNPRADFSTMYRFILTDLNKAEKYINGYTRSTKTLPDLSVVYGLKARFWLELATRFNLTPADLATAIENDKTDGYDHLGVTSAKECYEKARENARKTYKYGYTPLTKTQWLDNNTGFNKANTAWMWAMSYSTKEQLPTYYFSFPGAVVTEANWSMGRGYKAYRMCGSYLYSMIGKGDWRRYSWVDPQNDSTEVGYQVYVENSVNAPLLTSNEFKELPAYVNLKFRPAAGGMDDNEVGCLFDIPLMRIEEMYFIDFECTAHIDGVASASSEMASFVNRYRYTDNSYTAAATEMTEFNRLLMLQRRIEFWGEGITYFDIKRLKLPVQRLKNVDPNHKNYEAAFLMNSKDGGYVAPWMNYYITDYEKNVNTSIILNPDPSGVLTVNKK